MYTFTSVNNRMTIFGETVNKEPEFIVNFEPIGSVGRFTTDSKELAEKLRSLPIFGKKIMEIGTSSQENPKIVNGIRSSETQTELGKEPIDPQKFIEFGKLQATLLKSDGTYRKDASEENKLKYETLKKELGELE